MTSRPAQNDTTTVSTADLVARFRPTLQALESSALQREQDHELPYSAYRALKAEGFGKVRLGRDDGGDDITVPQLLELIAAVAQADSNIAQSWRTHILAVERFRTAPQSAHRDEWLRRIAQGDVIGGAWTESADVTIGVFTTTIAPDAEGVLRLNGRKFYSTGSLLADWLEVGAVDADGEFVIASIPARRAGVELLDDWDGFGQQLTSSGTTIFTDVEVAPADVAGFSDNHEGSRGWQQVVLLAILTGIARAAEHLAVTLVRERAAAVGDVEEVDTAALGSISAEVLRAETALRAAGEILQRGDDALIAAAAEEGGRESVASLLGEAELQTFRAQLNIVPATLSALNSLIGVVPGVRETRHWARIDQLWRNARTISSHNPVAFKQRMVGDRLAFGVDFGARAEDRRREQ
ncbi:monooxygenase [Pseudoclavibacter sp. CFCC 14310]|uniref:monooxygenase n=1 Tax=Pseudoclavibacter sp. CFCC 14310 TaxID=2615180 RepID=UPI0013010149|nr:monooxygenase [Pseudoclavibacter sp. CFCC 14310]KAB1644494.1 monooxygenase [Pseudoclavibacter sp. CFCC 14310]